MRCLLRGPKKPPLSPVEEWQAKKQKTKVRNEQKKAAASLCNSMANSTFAACALSVVVSSMTGNLHVSLSVLKPLFLMGMGAFFGLLVAGQFILGRLEKE